MNNMKFHREKAGLTQKAVAITLKVSTQTVSYWEKGERVPSLENAISLAKLYNCSLDAMFLAEGQQKRSPPTMSEDELDQRLLTLIHELPPEKKKLLVEFLQQR